MVVNTEKAVRVTNLDVGNIYNLRSRDRVLVIIDVEGFKLATNPKTGTIPSSRLERWLASIDTSITECLAKLDLSVNRIDYILHQEDVKYETQPNLRCFTQYLIFNDRDDVVDHMKESKERKDFAMIALVTDYHCHIDNIYWEAIMEQNAPKISVQIQYSSPHSQQPKHNDVLYCCPLKVTVHEARLEGTST